MDNYLVVRECKRRKLNGPKEQLSLHQLNIFVDKIMSDTLNHKYFYCANRDCYKIKETGRLFCSNHSVYNTTVLKRTPIKIHPSFIQNKINLQTETLDTDFYLTRKTF